ncbi:hypothetical protein B0A52_09305 [Exophiala mesophila]|uniref:Uncharacterized protein n=1 Tax=Exophiala mesophila TaxID=212818 RepID=A0A438MWF4_EXOME|nr:hypothetical protein B0A52_09305 [Exophiala mesophila]
MGNDGGSIPTRRELVKEAARNPSSSELKDKQKEHLSHRWSTCPVSNKPLVKPVVSDYSGELYNKDAIIQFLLPAEVSSVDKEEYEKFIQGRIKSLKDVVELQFEVDNASPNKTARWICPITSKELGPNVKAVYIVPCGHVFSHEAIKEMKGDGKCVQCATTYEERDIVPILPSTETDKSFVLSRIEVLKSLGLTHALKRASGGKKRKANADSNSEPTAATTTSDRPSSKVQEEQDAPQLIDSSGKPRSGTSTPRPSNGIKDSATANLTARVLQEEAARKKQRRENDTISSLYTKKNDHAKHDGNFMTRGFTIPADARHQ